jgi:hypothetical protein
LPIGRGEDGISGGEGGSVSGANDIGGIPGGIPLAFGVVGNLGQQGDQMEPRQLVSSRLTNSEIGTHLGEKPQVFQIGTGEALYFREGVPKGVHSSFRSSRDGHASGLYVSPKTVSVSHRLNPSLSL